MSDLFGKKCIESILDKMKNITEQRINIELIRKCYELLDYYRKPLNSNYDKNVSNFCSELRSHLNNGHHFPYEVVRNKWRNKIIEYLTYAKDNIENFKKII